eukprot:8158554-Karenia_brevis.AAC.1
MQGAQKEVPRCPASRGAWPGNEAKEKVMNALSLCQSMCLSQAQDETKTEIEKMLSDVKNVNIGEADFKDLERICEEQYEARLKDQVQLRGINNEGS